jgi:hypothetical protein
VKTIATILLTFLSSLLLTGCLTVETKEYRFKLKSDQSGEATIRFENIHSESDDTLDVSKDDFAHLIDAYVKGNKLEMDNPGFHNVQKRLFEENGVLVGEITFTFDSLSVVRMFKYDNASPYMYLASTSMSSEHFLSSNGTLGAQWMPVVFWPKSTREFVIKTRVTSEVSYQRSLVKFFREWKAKQTSGEKKQ